MAQKNEEPQITAENNNEKAFVSITELTTLSAPNPTIDFVTVKASENIDQITVYNQRGEQITFIEGKSNELKIDLSTRPAGTYLALVESGSKANSVKIVKN